MSTAILPNDVALEDRDKRSVLHSFSALHSQGHREPVIWESAQGIRLTDIHGNEYLDAAAGLWCTLVGYGREELAEVAAEQIRRTSSVHSFAQFSNKPLIALTERLLEIAPPQMRRVLFGNSGSDANDTQIKLVRRYNNIRGLPSKKKIIARASAYHGSTIGAASLCGLPLVHRTFDLPIEGILHTEAPDYHRRAEVAESPDAFCRRLADDLDRLIQREGPDTVAAFIAEPISGAGGVIVPPARYFPEIQAVLRKHDVLLICDEVITGFGRTGSWFASPELGAEPDLMSLSKGITSGYFPLSACLVGDKVADVLYGETDEDGYFGHGFTASGHSVGAAVALANIDIIERDGLIENSRAMGDYLLQRIRERVEDHELVGDIRGRGLMIGVEFDKDKSARTGFDDPAIVGSLLGRAALAERLIVRGGHGRVLAALAPSLTITRDDADEIVDRFEKTVHRFADLWHQHSSR